MTYEVRLSPQAVSDLRYLYEEKQVETSHHAAVWFIGLEAAVFSLESMPRVALPLPKTHRSIIFSTARSLTSTGLSTPSTSNCAG